MAKVQPWLALLVTVGAGLTTCLGAFLVFLVRKKDPQIMSALALAFAGGVMLYVSLFEILGKEAREKFEEHFRHSYKDKPLPHNLHTWVELYVLVFFVIGFGATMLMITLIFHPILEKYSGDGETNEDENDGEEIDGRENGGAIEYDIEKNDIESHLRDDTRHSQRLSLRESMLQHRGSPGLVHRGSPDHPSIPEVSGFYPRNSYRNSYRRNSVGQNQRNRLAPQGIIQRDSPGPRDSLGLLECSPRERNGNRLAGESKNEHEDAIVKKKLRSGSDSTPSVFLHAVASTETQAPQTSTSGTALPGTCSSTTEQTPPKEGRATINGNLLSGNIISSSLPIGENSMLARRSDKYHPLAGERTRRKSHNHVEFSRHSERLSQRKSSLDGGRVRDSMIELCEREPEGSPASSHATIGSRGTITGKHHFLQEKFLGSSSQLGGSHLSFHGRVSQAGSHYAGSPATRRSSVASARRIAAKNLVKGRTSRRESRVNPLMLPGDDTLSIHSNAKSQKEDDLPPPDKSLFRVTLITVLALSIDNVPEGITTFFAVINGGWTLPLSLVLHNIPEGFALAVPTYLSTGSFKKSLLVAFMAGASQILGGLVGMIMYLCGLKEFSALVGGCMYAVIAGITVIVVLLELLPESYERSPSAVYVSLAWFTGFLLAQSSIIVMKQIEFATDMGSHMPNNGIGSHALQAIQQEGAGQVVGETKFLAST